MIIPRFNYHSFRKHDPNRARRRDQDLAAYRLQEAKRLHNEGHSNLEIADLLGVCVTYVAKLLRRQP